MKTSSAPAPVKRSAAMNCLLVNQFATPGLGSLMGKRIWEGVIQLSLAVVGFVLVMAWMILFTYHAIADQAPQSALASGMGWLGMILFVGSWLLSWFTSLSLLRQAKQNPEPPPTLAPPTKPQPPILKQ
jgi:hypothetical protein